MKDGILLVAYGTLTIQGRRVLTAFDERVRRQFPSFSVRWAYTSKPLRQRLALSRQKSDSVSKGLLKMCFERFARIVVQPLQTIDGFEYGEMCATIAAVEQEHRVAIAVGKPLLADACAIGRVARSLLALLPKERTAEEDVIFMGHGSRHPSTQRYAELHAAVHALDKHVHVGTMEGLITLDVLLPTLTSKRVWLMPLLSTVGRHTLHDMAGQTKSSWCSRLDAAGHECHPILQGTVEHSAIADIWLDHLSAAARPFC